MKAPSSGSNSASGSPTNQPITITHFPIIDIQIFQFLSSSFATSSITSIMAAIRSFAMLSRARPASAPIRVHLSARKKPTAPIATALFSTSANRAATPAGAPPSGFRLPRQKRWDENSETSLDKAGNYFLMTEMLRGMYVVLEQFFRPP